jgi:hypothetical protein
VPTKVAADGNVITVHKKLLMPIVDGKVYNALTKSKSSQKCYVCGLTPNEMNCQTIMWKKVS